MKSSEEMDFDWFFGWAWGEAPLCFEIGCFYDWLECFGFFDGLTRFLVLQPASSMVPALAESSQGTLRKEGVQRFLPRISMVFPKDFYVFFPWFQWYFLGFL